MDLYNKIMKVFWLVFAIILFLIVTFKCFSEGFQRWAVYYLFVLLAVGMYFFKIWMMKRMERHIAYMKEQESLNQKNNYQFHLIKYHFLVQIRTALLFILTLTFPFAALSQYFVDGIVYDETYAPIPFAKMFCKKCPRAEDCG